MKKRFIKLGSMVLAVMMALSVMMTPVQAIAAAPESQEGGDPGIVQGGNDQLSLYVNGADGRFAVLPAGEAFTEDLLKSYAAVSIGGTEYRYGASYPDAGTHFSGVMVQDDTLMTQWIILDYAIQQHIKVVRDEDNYNSWAAHIWYDILYAGAEAGDIALRLLLDTRFGDDDSAAVMVGEESITTGRHFDEAPAYFHVPETAEGPKAFAVMGAEADAVAPAALSFLNYGQAQAAEQLFALQADAAQSLAPDSAALFDFPKNEFAGGAEDEAGCRVIYSLQYGFYGIGVEDGKVELDPAELGLEELTLDDLPFVSTEATYPIAERVSNLKNLLVYPTGAAPGATVEVQRVPQPEGIVYREENLLVPDADPALSIMFTDGTRSSVGVGVKTNADGTITYSFTMPAAAELDAHGGGVLLDFEANIAPGYYALQVQDPTGPALTQDVQLFSDLPHNVAKPGTTVNLAAASATTGKIYLDIINFHIQSGTQVEYLRLDATVLPDSEMELGGILDEFVSYYTMKMPSAPPADEGDAQYIKINVVRDPVLANFDFPEGTSVWDYLLKRDGKDGMHWYYRYSTAGMENWESTDLQSYFDRQSVILDIGTTIPVTDYNAYKVAVFDGEGNELPFFYYDSGYEIILFDPTGTIAPSAQAAYTLETVRPTLSSIYTRYTGGIYQAMAAFYLPALSPSGGKLSDVRLFIGTDLPNLKDITVVDSAGKALSSNHYAISATKAVPNEQVQLTLFDNSMLFINDVRFSTPVTGPGGTPAEVQKNRVYDFVMPAGALTITVDLQAPPVPKQRFTITPHHVVNQQRESIYEGQIMDQAGAEIRSQLAGERVYLSAPVSQHDPQYVGLEAEPYRVFYKAAGLSDDLTVYPAAGDANAPAGAAWYFVMPEQEVGVTFRTTLIETRKSIVINETAESFVSENGATYSYELDATHTFSTVNGSYMDRANPGKEVRLVLQKQVFARQMKDGQWTGSQRFLYGPNVKVQDTAGDGVAVRLVPAAEMNYDAETYYEYAFTMPESEAIVDINWRLGTASILTIDPPRLPAGVEAPAVQIEPVSSRTANGTSIYDVVVRYPFGDHSFSIDQDKLPVGVVSVVRKGDIVVQETGKYSVVYQVEINQDTTITLAIQELPPYPTITSATQNTPYHALYPKLYLTGHGISSTTNEDAAFDYRVTYATRKGGSGDTASSAAQSLKESSTFFWSQGTTQSDGSVVWSTFLFDTGTDRPYSEAVTGKMDLSGESQNLCHVTIEASRKGLGHWVHVFDTPIEFATEVTTAAGEYNFLSVVKEDGAKSYKAVGAKDQYMLDRQLQSLNAGTRLLNISTDAGFEYNADNKTFTLLNGEGDAQVKIGSVLTAEVPKGALFSVYENNGSVRVRMASSVKLASPKKDLLVPPKTASSGKYFEINFKKNTGYATRYDEIYNTTGKPKVKPVQVEWNNEIIPSLLQLNQAISAKLSNIQIFDKNIVVGGSLNLAIPKVGGKSSDIIKVDVEQVKYGYVNSRDFDMEGFKANGAAQIPDILSSLPVEAGAKADIDTLGPSKYYHFEVELVLMDIGFDGELTLIPGASKRYPQWLLPDKFNANVYAPIPIVPGVLELSRLGGGFSNLSETINADYSNITQMIPPLKLSVGGTLELLEILYGDFHAYLGASDFWFDVKGGATFMDIKDMLTSQFGYKLRYEKTSKVVNGKRKYSNDPNNAGAYHITLGGGAVVDFLPETVFLAGVTDFGIDLWIDLSYEHLLADDGKTDIKEVMRKNTAVEFHMYGSLRFQIPKFRFLGLNFGPYVLFGVDAALTHQFVRASVTIIGIRVGFSYNWSTRKPGFIFELASADEGSPTTSVPAYDEEGELVGTVQFGENLTLLATTEDATAPAAGLEEDARPEEAGMLQEAAMMEGAMARQTVGPMALGGANIVVQGKTHLVTVPKDPKYDADYSVVVQVGLTSDKFTVLRLDDSGQDARWLPYALNGVRMEEAFGGDAAQSDAVNALLGEDATLMQLAPGEWKVVANESFDSWVLEAKAAPQLTALTAGAGQIQLKAAHLEAGGQYYVNYGLNHTPAGGTEQYTDLGTMKVAAADIAADGTLNLNIPLDMEALRAELDSGSYTVYARLLTDIPDVTEPQGADEPVYTGDKEQLDFLRDRTNPIQIENSQAPVAVSDVQVSAGPNSSMKISWPVVDGANQYEVALYEVNANEQTPLVAMQTSDIGEVQTPMVYTVEAGENATQANGGSGGTVEKTVTGLPVGGTFTVAVTALKSVTEHFEMPSIDEDGKLYTGSLASVNSYRSASAFASGSATIAQSKAPSITITRAVDNGAGLELTIGEAGGIIQAVSADETACDMTLYAQVIDGESVNWKSVATATAATDLSHTVGYAEAASVYMLEAVNPETGDSTTASFMVNRASVAPSLTVNLTDNAVLSNGTDFSITGVTQPLATVAANISGADDGDDLLSTTADAAGNFKLKGTLAQGEKTRSYTLAATGPGGVTYQDVQVKYADPAETPVDTSPQTGDRNQPLLWLAVLGVTLVGLGALAAVFIVKRRRSRR